MLTYLADLLTPVWGPARLLSSYVILATVGSLVSALATWLLLPKLWNGLPRDTGRAHAVGAADSVGKPVGVGIIMILIFATTVAFFAPIDPHVYFCIGAVVLASSGSPTSWWHCLYAWSCFGGRTSRCGCRWCQRRSMFRSGWDC